MAKKKAKKKSKKKVAKKTNNKVAKKKTKKVKLSKTKETIAAVVIDESGSMGPLLKDTIGGFNQYISELQKQKGKCSVTLTKFNSWQGFRVVYSRTPLKDVPTLTEADYSPSGGTPLYDAIGKTINELEKSLDGEKANAIIVVMTDGQENSSREYDRKAIKTLVDAKEKDGWTFVFLGANLGDSTQVDSIAKGFGFQHSASYAVGKTQETLVSVATVSNNYRSNSSLRGASLMEKSGLDSVQLKGKDKEKETANSGS